MWAWILLLFGLGIASGFILFRKLTIPQELGLKRPIQRKLSVIIPARNEESNLPHLLRSIQTQTYQPFEIIVVDDGSIDRTRDIATSFGVKVVENTSLPPGWTGKSWAVWNGYLHASGDLIAFLDADIRLAQQALESLLCAREAAGGVISVVPYHHTEKWHERLALVTNILGLFAFTSPFEKENPKKGLYGSLILTTREDYERIRGHQSVMSEVLDDLNLGARYREAGIRVTNYIGYGMVAFRMYPDSLRSEIEGFSKGAVLSTSALRPATVTMVALWVVGLTVSAAFPLALWSAWGYPMLCGYVFYTAQMIYFVRYVGKFGKMMPVLHVVSLIFFLYVMLYSLYQVKFLGHVAWKGRHVKVGRGTGAETEVGKR